jgi:hypothetical protein
VMLSRPIFLSTPTVKLDCVILAFRGLFGNTIIRKPN